MEVRILGAHNSESATTKLASLLVDDVLAIDAGGLTSSLSLSEQERVKFILLSHHHYDHIRDVPALALNNAFSQSPTEVYAPAVTLEALSGHFMNGLIYPRFTEMPSPENPALKLCPLEPYQPRVIAGYAVVALPVNHTIPSVGYQVTSSDGNSLFYSGDTGPGCSSCWEHISPQLLIMDATLPDALEKYAMEGGHLSPRLLGQELAQFAKMKGYLPPVVVVHMSPQFGAEIREQIGRVARELGANITLGYEGMRLRV